MSIAELTANAFPRYSGKLAMRRLNQRRLRVLKMVRRHKNKTVRSLISWQRSQYYVATAVRDLKVAAKRNEDIAIASLFITLTIIFAFASTVARIALQTFLTMSYLNDITSLSVLLLALLFGGVLATMAAWLAAWTSNVLSIAVMDGATRRRNKSLLGTFRRSLRGASRTATAWLLQCAVLFGPMMLVMIISMLTVHTITGGGMIPYFYGLIVTGCFSTLWLLYALPTYSLAPQVALFEPNLPLLSTLKRSQQLVCRRGRPFLLATYLIVAAWMGACYMLAEGLSNIFGSASDIVFYGGALLAVIATNLMLTILYRKRRLARTN